MMGKWGLFGGIAAAKNLMQQAAWEHEQVSPAHLLHPSGAAGAAADSAYNLAADSTCIQITF